MGRILHGFGNVKASQAKKALEDHDDDVSYERLMGNGQRLHQAALIQLASTFGEYHHRVADLCHKIAGHN
ncbi:hypothetical protein QQS21_002690, partial [Conoideocrella luteorostrata]